MESKILQILLLLSASISLANAQKATGGNLVVIIISILLPAFVLIAFCGGIVFICKNRKKIPLLRSKFGTHERIPHSTAPKTASAPPPMMPPPQPQPQPEPVKGGDKKEDDDLVKPAAV